MGFNYEIFYTLSTKCREICTNWRYLSAVSLPPRGVPAMHGVPRACCCHPTCSTARTRQPTPPSVTHPPSSLNFSVQSMFLKGNFEWATPNRRRRTVEGETSTLVRAVLKAVTRAPFRIGKRRRAPPPARSARGGARRRFPTRTARGRKRARDIAPCRSAPQKTARHSTRPADATMAPVHPGRHNSTASADHHALLVSFASQRVI